MKAFCSFILVTRSKCLLMDILTHAKGIFWALNIDFYVRFSLRCLEFYWGYASRTFESIIRLVPLISWEPEDKHWTRSLIRYQTSSWKNFFSNSVIPPAQLKRKLRKFLHSMDVKVLAYKFPSYSWFFLIWLTIIRSSFSTKNIIGHLFNDFRPAINKQISKLI